MVQRFLPSLLLLTSGCSSMPNAKGIDPVQRIVAWGELVSARQERFEPHPDAPIERPITSFRLSKLTPSVRRHRPLAKLALDRSMHEATVFNQGIYGKLGSATVFATTPDRIPNFDRLYWIMVRVLSEKYGCFIRQKKRIGNEFRFRCRDRRTVYMRRRKGRHWIQFYGRQFDQNGNELVVSNRKIIARRKVKPDPSRQL